MKVTFNQLWVGDRFYAYDRLWTKIDHQTARKHSPESNALGLRGYGYNGDALCTFGENESVMFEPVVRDID